MKKIMSISLVAVLILTLAGCNWFEKKLGDLKEALVGREMIIQSYDENSQLIDRVQGKSVSIKADDEFELTDVDGNVVEKSSVLNITVGGNEIIHVGSSLISHELGLENIFDVYTKSVDLDNFDRSVPFVNRMVNELKNYTTGKDKIILIRSQSGQPLATFAGDDVSYYSTDIENSTALLIDGEFLFIYRCDYTIYDTELLQ